MTGGATANITIAIANITIPSTTMIIHAPLSSACLMLQKWTLRAAQCRALIC